MFPYGFLELGWGEEREASYCPVPLFLKDKVGRTWISGASWLPSGERGSRMVELAFGPREREGRWAEPGGARVLGCAGEGGGLVKEDTVL